MSVTSDNILYNIYPILNPLIASKLHMESEKNNKILLFTTANNSQYSELVAQSGSFRNISMCLVGR